MAYQLWMRSLLNRMKELYGHTEAKTIAEALPDGDFFVIKGSVATIGDLPSSGNRVGDIYIVSEDGSEHIWVTNTTYPNGYWEQLGTEGVTAASVASAIGDMTAQQAATTRGNLGAEPEKFVVTITYDDQNDEYTADKTVAEMYAAYQAGKNLVALFNNLEYILCSVTSDPMVSFTNIETSGSNFVVRGIDIDDTDLIVVYHHIAKPRVTINSNSTANLTPEDNRIYNFTAAALTSLTITNPPATGTYVIKFNSGSTPTTTTIPSTIHGLESFAAEANTHYEINVEDNYAVVGKWAIS